MVIAAQNTNQKPGYKQTEVGVIPEDWEVKKLSEITEVVMGQSPIGTSYNRDGYGYPLINGPTEFTDRYPIKIQWTNQPTKFCKKNDILLCVRGSSTGRINIANDDYCIGRGIAAIRAKTGVDTRYITFQVICSVINMLALTTGSTFPNIDGKSIRSIKVPLPPLLDQRAIATALSDIDALITSLDKLIAKKRDIKQATMQQLLTGKMQLPGFSGDGSAKLGDFFELNPNKPYLNDADLVTFIRMEDISESGRIINRNTMPLSLIKKGLTFFERNDVLVAKITPCFENGKGACLDTLETKSGFGSTEFHVLRAKKNAVPRYVFYQTQTVEFRQRLETEMIGTAGQKRVPARAIINYSLPVLHLIDEQRAIAAILSDMDAEIAALEQKRDKTCALKQGMMQELLTGKTRLLSPGSRMDDV